MQWLIERYRLLLACLAGCLLFSFTSKAELGYASNLQLREQLKALAKANTDLVRVDSMGRSLRSNDIWLVELGTGRAEDRKVRPALLLVAGIEGTDLAGTASAVAWIKSLAEDYPKNSKTRQLLDSTTIYVFPRLNPDAPEFFFTKPRMEVAGNLKPVDDDHDGLVDEDGPEDLDKDGRITSMRVEDPDGEYIPDPGAPRLMIKADRKKGEKGAWRILSEGLDNDHDEEWNEDGPGGVNLNRNYPYNHKFFAAWAGLHQVSEIETRSLADFAVSHPNIGIVFTFGSADNLVQTPKGEAPKRPPVAIHEEDISYYRELGKAWRDALGLKKELGGSSEPGTFSDWMYYHRGRLSLAGRPWSPALQLELAKAKKEQEKPKGQNPPEEKAATETKKDAGEVKKESKAKSDKEDAAKAEKKEGDNRNEEERAFLKWIDENAPQSFVNWKPYQHPDFPGKRVEVGGFAPFAKILPPEKLLEDLTRRQSSFLTDLAGKLPRMGIRNIKTKHLENGVYDVTVQVENSGYLPTALAQGNVSREVYPTRVVLKLDKKFILAGTQTTMLGPIEGNGGRKEIRYVILADPEQKIVVEVISMLGGTARQPLDLLSPTTNPER